MAPAKSKCHCSGISLPGGMSVPDQKKLVQSSGSMSMSSNQLKALSGNALSCGSGRSLRSSNGTGPVGGDTEG